MEADANTRKDNMILDKDIKKYLEEYHKKGFPPYSSFTPTALRKWFNNQFFQKTQPEIFPIGKRVEHSINIDGKKLTCRVYHPPGEGPFPALMYFHGGGFVIRDNMDIYDQTCKMMCHHANCIIIAVDFRLAPENPFPTPAEDCYLATCWVANHVKELNIAPGKLGVWGESCGGNLATVVSMMARDRKGPQITCQIIITAMLEYDFTTQSYLNNGQGQYLLSQDSMQWFWDCYITNKADKNNPYCAPCTAVDLSNLPPAFVVTVGFDPLHDEGKKYSDQLKFAGVQTQYRCYSGLIHGFFDLYSTSALAKNACHEIMTITKNLLIK